MIHLEIQGFPNHGFGNGILEHTICLDCMETHNMNVASDQVGCLEDDILEDPMEYVDGQFSLERDVVIDKWREESKPLSSRIQLN